MAREEMFEPDVGEKVAGAVRNAVIVRAAVADQEHTLGPVLPRACLQTALPHVPVSFYFVGAIGAVVLAHHGNHVRSGCLYPAEVLFQQGSFRGVDRTNGQSCKSMPGSGERKSFEEAPEPI